MKTLLVIMVFASNAFACEAGCTSYQGTCACDQVPEKAVQTTFPSDEKPPRHPEPAYQRGDITVDMPTSTDSEDAKLDQEKAQAATEGKKAAGL